MFMVNKVDDEFNSRHKKTFTEFEREDKGSLDGVKFNPDYGLIFLFYELSLRDPLL